jgi:hypothetical protein
VIGFYLDRIEKEGAYINSLGQDDGVIGFHPTLRKALTNGDQGRKGRGGVVNSLPWMARVCILYIANK